MRKTSGARRRLRDLRVEEVSLVDQPDNPGARVVLHKRREEPQMTNLEKALARNEGAYEPIEELARERVHKRGHGITREQAVAELLRERPELYEDYLQQTAVGYGWGAE